MKGYHSTSNTGGSEERAGSEDNWGEEVFGGGQWIEGTRVESLRIGERLEIGRWERRREEESLSSLPMGGECGDKRAIWADMAMLSGWADR